jgi:hypothetical protein
MHEGLYICEIYWCRTAAVMNTVSSWLHCRISNLRKLKRTRFILLHGNINVSVRYIKFQLCCNVNVQSAAKQRFGKQTSTIQRLFSMGSMPLPLLCNGSVDKFQQ